jgi:hypothetical protein
MDEHELRIKKARKPSKEELLRLLNSTDQEKIRLFARLSLVPENPSRQAYTVLRKIYLAIRDGFWNVFVNPDQQHIKEWAAQVTDSLDKLRELESWFIPALQPLSLEAAAKLIEGSKSEFWRQSIMSQVGKRGRAGQPASKRHLALYALDLKCAYPDTSLREATDILCPCGNDEHTPQCREQLRQQINRLVKFLRTHGYDFTWERIKTEGWKEFK